MIIIGGGLAGCLAGALNPNSQIFEGGPMLDTHKAVLRFRSNKIFRTLGIPFKKEKVYKGIWHNDKPVSLSPRYINLYSRKVSDKLSIRSISNLDTVERYIAPADFHDQLRNICKGRIEYNEPVDTIIQGQMANNEKKPCMVSTLPMFVLAKLAGVDINISKDKNVKPIKVTRLDLDIESDVYMTYYYTDPTVNCYRASLEGSQLIIESMFDISDEDIKVVMRSFGLTGVNSTVAVKDFEQHNGKISKMDEEARKEFIFQMTYNHRIYSLGRFATWRNLVLDDVFDDILVIRRMLNQSMYDHHKEHHNGS